LITAASKMVEAPLGLADVATKLVEAIAINSVSEKIRRKRPVVIKRRNIHSGTVGRADETSIFRVADIPIRFWSKVEDWQRWENRLFQHVEWRWLSSPFLRPANVVADKLPGESLWDRVNRGTLTRRMLLAAAAEFRALMNFWSDEFRGRWSHGDASITNVIYESEQQSRAADRFRNLPREIAGHCGADKRTTCSFFLLDLVGTLPTRQCCRSRRLFGSLRRRRSDRAIAEATRSARRTGLDLVGRAHQFTNPATVKRRLANLSRAIAKMKSYDANSFGARAKQTPGFDQLPNDKSWNSKPSSRRRAIKERANALHPVSREDSNKNVTALLNTKTAGHGEGSGADCECVV